MSNKTMKLVFKENASNEVKNGVEISFGMEFKRLFKQADEPFQVDRKIGNAILRNYNYFKEFEEAQESSSSAKKQSEAPLTLSGLRKLGREKLNDLAVKEYGIENAAELPNIEAVAKEILKVVQSKSKEKEPAPKTEDEQKTIDPNQAEKNAAVTESYEEKSEESSTGKDAESGS